MYLIHPIVQGCAILLSLYVAFLGLQRFLMLHLKQKRRFLWKRHVRFGLVALIALLAGIAGGLSVVRLSWNKFLITGSHGITGLILVPLIVFGIITGVAMNKKKKKRRLLPLLHGINNTLIILVGLIQIHTGFEVYTAFVLGN